MGGSGESVERRGIVGEVRRIAVDRVWSAGSGVGDVGSRWEQRRATAGCNACEPVSGCYGE